MASLTAKDIMTSEATFSPDMDIYRAMEQLLKRQLTGAPVVDENHMLIGMLNRARLPESPCRRGGRWPPRRDRQRLHDQPGRINRPHG